MSDHSNTTQNEARQSRPSDAYSYYNNVQDQGLDRRSESPIYYQRNCSNWIKSMLIQQYITRLKMENPDRAGDLCVFDMGCGKGGDIPKWLKSGVKSIVFADLSENLIKQCKVRFDERNCRFPAKFLPLDCTTERLSDRLNTKEPQFDLVSTQFVLHYSFESYEKANRFLQNAAELLRIGGYFIGTTVNGCRLVQLCREAPNQTISNDVFRIHFDESVDLKCEKDQQIPLFGVKYHFTLEEVVDCPEYLVYFPLLKELAKRHGLEFVDRATFRDYFERHYATDSGRFLLTKMDTLQRCDQSTVENNSTQFGHVREYIERATNGHTESRRAWRSISKQEWDVNNLYIIFAFKKIRDVNYDDETTSS